MKTKFDVDYRYDDDDHLVGYRPFATGIPYEQLYDTVGRCACLAQVRDIRITEILDRNGKDSH